MNRGQRPLVADETALEGVAVRLLAYPKGAHVLGLGATNVWSAAGLLGASALTLGERRRGLYFQNLVNIGLFSITKNRHDFFCRLVSRENAGTYLDDPGARIADAFNPRLLADTAHQVGRAAADYLGSALRECDHIALLELLWRHAFFGLSLTACGVTLRTALNWRTHTGCPVHFLANPQSHQALERLVRAGKVTIGAFAPGPSDAPRFIYVGDQISAALARELRAIFSHATVVGALRDEAARERGLCVELGELEKELQAPVESAAPINTASPPAMSKDEIERCYRDLMNPDAEGAATAAFMTLVAHDRQAHAHHLLRALTRGLPIALSVLTAYGFLDDAAVVAALIHRSPLCADRLWPEPLIKAVQKHRDALLALNDFSAEMRRAVEILSTAAPPPEAPEWREWATRLLNAKPSCALAEGNGIAYALDLFGSLSDS